MFKAHNFCSFCFPSLPLKWGGQGISPPPLFTGVLLFCVNMTVNDLAFVAKLYTKKSVFYAIYIYLRPCKGREGTSGGHSAPSNNHQSGQKFNLNCADDSQHTGEQPWQLNFASAQHPKLTKKKEKKKRTTTPQLSLLILKLAQASVTHVNRIENWNTCACSVFTQFNDIAWASVYSDENNRHKTHRKQLSVSFATIISGKTTSRR